MRRLHVAFFGTDEVSLATLRRLQQDATTARTAVSSLVVVCPADRPAGRGQKVQAVPVRRFAVDHGIPTVEVPYGIRKLKDFPPPVSFTSQPLDVGVVVSFGYFLTKPWLAPLRLAAINMHPSLLPKYRGSAPVPRCILAGDTRTGLSIIDIHPNKFDAGAILHQEEVDIGPQETAVSLTARLAERGADAVLRILAQLREGQPVHRRPQQDADATPAPKLAPEDGLVRWTPDAPAVKELMTQWRAVHGTYSVYTFIRVQPPGKPSRVLRVALVSIRPCEPDGPDAQHLRAHDILAPGSLVALKTTRQLYLRASDGWLCLCEVQVATRRAVTGWDFAVGHHVGVDGLTKCTDEPA